MDYETTTHKYFSNEWLRIIFYSLSMLVGSYMAGYLPLSFNLSENMIAYTSSLGAGLLIGTALIVIIPEGVNALYRIDPDLTDFKTILKEQAENLNHVYLGVALISGFLLMFIIDQVIFQNSHSHTPEDATNSLLVPAQASRQRNPSTATIGLVVHSAADGVALGAASASGHSHVELLIFLAIILHKAPAAFGLTSVLLHAGCDKRKIKKHLFFFSIAAPLTAVVIFFFLSQFGREGVISDKMNGIALLFSAGTFLYVATVHVIPELTQSKGKLSRTEISCILIGSLIPLLFSVLHQH